ncbi:MAG TPA: DUF4384 domain-containing protein [Bryobacteraceae bacterium]|nr:DUF4384 domain-containing protein [Bryobacteraceae bacterium]
MPRSIRPAFCFVLVCSLASFAPTAAQQRKLAPRDLFYEAKAGSSSTPSNVPPQKQSSASLPVASAASITSRIQHISTLRYGILQRQPDGRFLGVDPFATVFHSGDQLRIRVEANQDGYMYILQRGSSTHWSVLFPFAAISNGQNRTPAFQSCEIPSAAGQGFRLDARVGTEHVFLLFSRRYLTADALVASLNQPFDAEAKSRERSGEVIASAIRPVSGSMESRDLVLEKIEEHAPDAFKGIAFYAASSAEALDSPLLVHVVLRHAEASSR